MSELKEALEGVKKKIARYKGKDINEQNTKTALVNPVLRALGWDVGDLEEVQQEYRRKSRDKPVDYALFLLRTPRLFVEAKALGQNLDDRRWANQIMGYATVGGVEWVVITNGDEYRLYNSHATVPFEEKLFRTVRISEDVDKAAGILGLLTKDRIIDELDELWKAHFVDRQVRKAVEELFGDEPALSIVRLVAKRVSNLSAKDVKASLRRAQVHFDFPVKLSPPFAAKPKKPSRQRRVTPKGKGGFPAATRQFLNLGFRMEQVAAVLIRDGFLSAPLRLTAEYRGQTLEAQLLPDGQILFSGKRYKSPSGAAGDAKGTIAGRPMPTDGWDFWHYQKEDGTVVPLDSARQEFLKSKGAN